jgi:hypothetical protein
MRSEKQAVRLAHRMMRKHLVDVVHYASQQQACAVVSDVAATAAQRSSF